MPTSALQAQLFNIYTQEEERMRKNKVRGGRGYLSSKDIKAGAFGIWELGDPTPSSAHSHYELLTGRKEEGTLGLFCPFVNKTL